MRAGVKTITQKFESIRIKLFYALYALSLIFMPALAFAAEEGGHEATLLGVPHFVWFTIVNFIIFVAILVVVLRKPLANFLKGRKETVSKEIEDARKLLEEAEAHHADIAKRLDQMDKEIAAMRDQIMKEGELEGERILERAYQASERLQREADFQAEQEVKMGRQALREEAARLAVKLAEDVLRREVTEADRDRLVSEFLTEVKAK